MKRVFVLVVEGESADIEVLESSLDLKLGDLQADCGERAPLWVSYTTTDDEPTPGALVEMVARMTQANEDDREVYARELAEEEALDGGEPNPEGGQP